MNNLLEQQLFLYAPKHMNKAKNVERMTAYVKKVNAMVEKKKRNKK